MSLAVNHFHDPKTVRRIESLDCIRQPFSIYQTNEGPFPRWLNGDYAELSRLSIPKDSFAKIVQIDIDFRDISIFYQESFRSGLMGLLTNNDAEVYLTVETSPCPSSVLFDNIGGGFQFGNIDPILYPWANHSLIGLRGITHNLLPPFSIYKFNATDGREFPLSLPVPAGSILRLYLKVYRDLVLTKDTRFFSAQATARMIVELSTDSTESVDFKAERGSR